MASGNRLNKSLIEFIGQQPMFFVATAASDGRVNLSPKGMDTLRVMDERHVVWLNLSGSGNETAAHLIDNPRMTMMFCAFEGTARILRLYGTAKTVHAGDEAWQNLVKHFPAMPGARQIFSLTIDLVHLSCGTGVPRMIFEKQRGPDELLPFYEAMGPDGVRDYWKRKNLVSIDGKPTGLKPDA